MKGGLAYTQDHVLVRSLLLVNIAEKLEQQQLQKYFERYGYVERLDLYPIENGGRTGCVVFANPCDAAIALRAMFHDVSGCRIRVRSSYSWQQPDADEPDETPSAIMKLDDHCLEQIFSQLAVSDRVHFARTCSRFRNIYEGMSPSLDKSVNFQLFESMTARDVRDFFQLSGRNIKNIECTLPRSCFNQVYSLIGMHCDNLQSMIIKHNSFTNLKINIFQMFAHPNSLQNLTLRKCELIDEHLPAFKHMRQLKKLDLSYNNMITGRSTTTTQATPFITPPSTSPKTVEEHNKYESCGDQKECVPRWLCANDTINTGGENIIDIRINTDSPTDTATKTCSNYLHVCCNIPDKRDKPEVPITPVDTNRGCGYRNPKGVTFKITGALDQEAEFAEFPWMVAVLREEAALNLYECGGALITPEVILTAAHCVHNKDAKSLIVRAGEWDTQTKDEPIPHEDRYVKEIIYHEQFNKGSLYNDVALLFLESPFNLQENIQPVCLPNAGEQFDYDRCFATGWGKNKFGKDGEYQRYGFDNIVKKNTIVAASVNKNYNKNNLHFVQTL
ncbi:hypothetical protein ACLKA7_003433 [Drosophila subpalustris]